MIFRNIFSKYIRELVNGAQINSKIASFYKSGLENPLIFKQNTVTVRNFSK